MTDMELLEEVAQRYEEHRDYHRAEWIRDIAKAINEKDAEIELLLQQLEACHSVCKMQYKRMQIKEGE